MDSLYFLSMFFTSAASLALAIFFKAEDDLILTNTWRNFLLSIFVWAFGRAMMNIASNSSLALLWVRFSYSGSAWMGFLFMQLAYAVAKRSIKQSLFRGLSISCIVLTFLAWTPLFIKTVKAKNVFAFYEVSGGFVFELFSLTYTATLIWSHIFLFNEMKKSTGLQRNRIRYFLLSSVIGFAASSTTFPLVKDINLYPFGVPVIAIYPFLLTYSVLKYQLLDLYLLLRDTTVHIISMMIFGAACILLASIINKKEAYIGIMAFMSIAMPPSYPIISKWVRRKINRTRLGDVDRYLDDIEEKSTILIGSTLSISTLSETALDLVTSVFPIDDVGIYFMKSRTQSLHLYSQKGFLKLTKDIGKDDPIFLKLNQKKSMLNKEELLNDMDDASIRLGSLLKNHDVEIVSPLYASNQLAGFIALGQKISKGHFHKKDIEAIKILTKKIETACGYASAAEKYTVAMQDWSHSLNQITKPIELGAGMIKEFHDILPWDELKENVDIIIKRTMQLRQVHEYISNSSTISREIITGEYKKKPENISQIVRNYSENFLKEMKHKCTVNIPKDETQSNINKTSIERVIGELVSNSIRHTQAKGDSAHITITGWSQNGHYNVSIKDNGEGLDPEFLNKIWEPGWQQKDMNAGASGLGLAICKQIVEAHQGEISAFSTGKGSGMEISFRLPIIKQAVS